VVRKAPRECGGLRPEEPRFSIALISLNGSGEVFVSLQAAVVVWHHSVAHGEKEVAGLLLGALGEGGGRPLCRCDRALPARFCKEGRTWVTLTHRAWEDLSERKARWAPHLKVVGWYHSHPDIGVFVSADDTVAHKAAFGFEGSCAIVVDPIRREWGAFVYLDGALRPASLFVFAPKGMEEDLRRFLKAIVGAGA